MGYTTNFEGVLKFTKKPGKIELAYLGTLLGCDPEEVDGVIVPGEELSYIQLDLDSDETGIQWDGSEKFYEAVNAVNFVIRSMQAEFPDFGLEGELQAQGEDVSDRWALVIENGLAVKRELKIEGSVYECPHCHGKVLTSKARKLK